MSPDSPGSTQPQPVRTGWRQWLQLLVAALVLLALSELVWVWQSWPVRELLQPHAAQQTGGHR